MRLRYILRDIRQQIWESEASGSADLRRMMSGGWTKVGVLSFSSLTRMLTSASLYSGGSPPSTARTNQGYNSYIFSNLSKEHFTFRLKSIVKTHKICSSTYNVYDTNIKNNDKHCKELLPKIRNKYSQKRNCAATISTFMCL
jgi:hypothetical protein